MGALNNTKVKGEESGLPNPSKFMNQVLRGSAYSFSTAIADLLDNAIEAEAKNVEIIVDFDELRVSIVDNGKGMDDPTHFESMKVASETRAYSKDDLGKYGTGMKAASLSQARCLTVATRKRGENLITVRRIDMDHITATNDWSRVTLVMDESALPDEVLEKLRVNPGTAVIWDNIDTLFVSGSLNETGARSELKKQLGPLEDHLGMTFHKFLDGEVPDRDPLEITLNGQAIPSWDPFCRAESASTFSVPSPDFIVNGVPFAVKGYVLPGEKEFSSKQAFKRAGGAKKWVQSQGFWVYRNHRLIRGGGWLGMRSPDTHTILARVAIDFPSSLDPIFNVNVAKSKIELPQTVKNWLEPIVVDSISKAKKRYASQSKLSGLSAQTLPGRSSGGTVALNRRMTAHALAELLTKVAAASGANKELEVLQMALRKQNATVADDIGW